MDSVELMHAPAIENGLVLLFKENKLIYDDFLKVSVTSESYIHDQ